MLIHTELTAQARRIAERCRNGQLTIAADLPAPVGRQAVRHIERRTALVLIPARVLASDNRRP
jgi:hypothetical protein